MPLVKSPTLTAAKLAANRANARKSTGPRTHRGKCRVALNGLKHGRYAGAQFRSLLGRAQEDTALYDWILGEMRRRLPMESPKAWFETMGLAREVWCHFRTARRSRPNHAFTERPSRSSLWCSLHVPRQVLKGRRFPRASAHPIGTHALYPASLTIPIGLGITMTFRVRRAPRARQGAFALWLESHGFDALLTSSDRRLARLERLRRAEKQPRKSGLLVRLLRWPGVGPKLRSSTESTGT